MKTFKIEHIHCKNIRYIQGADFGMPAAEVDMSRCCGKILGNTNI